MSTQTPDELLARDPQRDPDDPDQLDAPEPVDPEAEPEE
jgi:hypothetical protein